MTTNVFEICRFCCGGGTGIQISSAMQMDILYKLSESWKVMNCTTPNLLHQEKRKKRKKVQLEIFDMQNLFRSTQLQFVTM